MRWNSGPVEGHVNRLKMLKRQMFGRANLDLTIDDPPLSQFGKVPKGTREAANRGRGTGR
jgi:hypothetical protein